MKYILTILSISLSLSIYSQESICVKIALEEGGKLEKQMKFQKAVNTYRKGLDCEDISDYDRRELIKSIDRINVETKSSQTTVIENNYPRNDSYKRVEPAEFEIRNNLLKYYNSINNNSKKTNKKLYSIIINDVFSSRDYEKSIERLSYSQIEKIYGLMNPNLKCRKYTDRGNSGELGAPNNLRGMNSYEEYKRNYLSLLSKFINKTWVCNSQSIKIEWLSSKSMGHNDFSWRESKTELCSKTFYVEPQGLIPFDNSIVLQFRNWDSQTYTSSIIYVGYKMEGPNKLVYSGFSCGNMDLCGLESVTFNLIE